jgi:hypothetical protein
MSHSSASPALVAFGRLTWMILGPLGLASALLSIINTGNGWLTPADAAYWVALGAMLLGRWLEFQGGRPETATGEPANPGHLRRYVVGASALGAAVWVAANLVANHWPAG